MTVFSLSWFLGRPEESVLFEMLVFEKIGRGKFRVYVSYPGGSGEVVGGDGEGGGDVDLTEKNATVISMNAIQMSMKPTKIMVSTAPINSSSPAVLNVPTADFSASLLSDLL